MGLALALGGWAIPRLSTSVSSAQSRRPHSAALDRALRGIVERPGRELASLAVAVVREGKIVYQNAFGRAWIDPEGSGRDRAATVDTLYRIASISKFFVALAAAELVARGQLEAEADVSDYLGFSLRHPRYPEQPISLAMLLSHTSGLTDAAGYNLPEGVALRELLLPEGARYRSTIWGAQAPGRFFRYCNLGFGVAAQVMERASGERFDRLMQRVLFGPLQVTASFDPATLPAAAQARVATLYRKRPAGDGPLRWDPKGPWVPQVDDFSREALRPRASPAYQPGTNGTLFAPQGGLRVSVADLARIMQILLAVGRDAEGRQVLTHRAIELCLRERWRYEAKAGNRASDDEGAGGLFNAWGFGPQRFLDISGGPGRGDRLVEAGGLQGWGHLGNAYGLTSAFIFDPARQHGLIFLSGGSAFDPEQEPGAYSAHYRYEEMIYSAIWRHLLAGY